jgi:hypothetical protein
VPAPEHTRILGKRQNDMLDQLVLPGGMRLFVRDVHTIATGEPDAKHYSCHNVEPSPSLEAVPEGRKAVDALFKQAGVAMSKVSSRVLASVAVATLAAAGVAAVIRHRQGRHAPADERAHLDELQVRLTEAATPGGLQPARVRRVIENLQRNQGITAAQLVRWIAALRHGTLTPEQATVAENDFDALEREADQGGA